MIEIHVPISDEEQIKEEYFREIERRLIEMEIDDELHQ